jgi:hypothetical protein
MSAAYQRFGPDQVDVIDELHYEIGIKSTVHEPLKSDPSHVPFDFISVIEQISEEWNSSHDR